MGAIRFREVVKCMTKNDFQCKVFLLEGQVPLSNPGHLVQRQARGV